MVAGDAVESGMIGLLGASSFIGQRFLVWSQAAGLAVQPFSRHPAPDSGWLVLGRVDSQPPLNLTTWVSAMPIIALVDYLPWLATQGCQKLVLLSTTSVFTRQGADDPEDAAYADLVMQAEATLVRWAEMQQVAWVILRPTLVYGYHQDKNVAEIARFIRRFGFFPVFGQASGLRQPVHVDDVVAALGAALVRQGAQGGAINLGGGEVLPYREMVQRIFIAQKKTPRLLTVPLVIFSLVLFVAHLFPRYRKLRASMAARMAQDMVFDNAEAESVLGIRPRPFDPPEEA